MGKRSKDKVGKKERRRAEAAALAKSTWLTQAAGLTEAAGPTATAGRTGRPTPATDVRAERPEATRRRGRTGTDGQGASRRRPRGGRRVGAVRRVRPGEG